MHTRVNCNAYIARLFPSIQIAPPAAANGGCVDTGWLDASANQDPFYPPLPRTTVLSTNLQDWTRFDLLYILLTSRRDHSRCVAYIAYMHVCLRARRCNNNKNFLPEAYSAMITAKRNYSRNRCYFTCSLKENG